VTGTSPSWGVHDGVVKRPDTTFGTRNADVLAHVDPSFRRGDLVRMVLDSPWPE
jgi:hypothetical protein